MFRKGNQPWNKGKKGFQPSSRKGIKGQFFHSEETKLKMSLSAKGKPKSPDHIEKCHFSQRGKKRPHTSGEKNWRWIKDRRFLKRARTHAYDVAYRNWMKAVKNRDGWQCKIANSNCSGRLESHHILSWAEYPELRYSLNNGITLCHAHHPRKRAEEKRLIPSFLGLISISKEQI